MNPSEEANEIVEGVREFVTDAQSRQSDTRYREVMDEAEVWVTNKLRTHAAQVEARVWGEAAEIAFSYEPKLKQVMSDDEIIARRTARKIGQHFRRRAEEVKE